MYSTGCATTVDCSATTTVHRTTLRSHSKTLLVELEPVKAVVARAADISLIVSSQWRCVRPPTLSSQCVNKSGSRGVSLCQSASWISNNEEILISEIVVKISESLLQYQPVFKAHAIQIMIKVNIYMK